MFFAEWCTLSWIVKGMSWSSLQRFVMYVFFIHGTVYRVKYAKLLESVFSIIIWQLLTACVCTCALGYRFCRNLREFVENEWKDWSLSGALLCPDCELRQQIVTIQLPMSFHSMAASLQSCSTVCETVCRPAVSAVSALLTPGWPNAEARHLPRAL